MLTWWANRRVRMGIYLSAVSLTVAWLGSYILWLSQGCMAFLPFVSDFAEGPSKLVFLFGLIAVAVFLLPSWFDYYYAIQGDLKVDRPYWTYLSKLVPLMGVFCSMATIGVALNPWDKRLRYHLIAAECIFVGGSVFMVIDGILRCGRGRSSNVTFFVSFCAFISLILMTVFFIRGSQALRSSGEEVSFEILGTDFQRYCRGENGSIHQEWNINMAAMFEWILLATMICTLFLKLREELHSWPDDMREVKVTDGEKGPQDTDQQAHESNV